MKTIGAAIGCPAVLITEPQMSTLDLQALVPRCLPAREPVRRVRLPRPRRPEDHFGPAGRSSFRLYRDQAYPDSFGSRSCAQANVPPGDLLPDGGFP